MQTNITINDIHILKHYATNKNEQNSYTMTTILLTLTHIHKHYANNKEEQI